MGTEEMGGGGTLLLIMIVALTLQLLCIRVIIKNYWEQRDSAPLAITCKRLSKLALNIDLPLISKVMLKCAEESAEHEDAQALQQASGDISFQDQVQSEKFKV